MKKNAAGFDNASDIGDRLDRADLGVGMLDRNQNRVGAQRLGARTTQVAAMVTLMEIFPVIGMAAMVVLIPLLSDGPS